MNIMELLLKFLMGAGGGVNMPNPVEISKQILFQIKKILKSLIILFICAVIFCLLLGYLIDRTLTQMDAGSVEFTNSIIFLIVLIVINLIVMAWALKKASEKDEAPVKEPRAEIPNPASPLETAVAALILNFIKERELTREAPSDKNTADL